MRRAREGVANAEEGAVAEPVCVMKAMFLWLNALCLVALHRMLVRWGLVLLQPEGVAAGFCDRCPALLDEVVHHGGSL